MSFMGELLNYLDTQIGGSWTQGTDLFHNALPQDKKRKAKLALYDDGGEPAHTVIAVYSPYFKLLSAASDMATARTNWETAFNILNRLKDTNLTSYQVAIIEALESNPRPIIAEANDFVLESNFRVVYKNISD